LERAEIGIGLVAWALSNLQTLCLSAWLFVFWKEEPLSVIVEVLWGMSEPHLHLFDKHTIFPKLVFMNSPLRWMKEVKFGWPNLDFVVDGQNSPIQFSLLHKLVCSHAYCTRGHFILSAILITCLLHQWSL
jgi:hypothetical protein